MNLFLYLIINGLAVFITAYLLPGVVVKDFFTAIVVAVILGIINALIKPVLIILTLPLNILTLGLLTFVINGFLILLTSALVPGFNVKSLLTAIIFSLILSIISSFLRWLSK
ncbi:MAG: phage holin family protein [Microgenomates group bacterium]|jgi:putative membrane protein|nr:phage holin family protein [Microgenomates group bacterium]